MAVEGNHSAAQPGRLAEMFEEFRVAKQRQLVRLGIKLWNRTEAQHAVTPIDKQLDLIDPSSRSE